jgi:hypothetical protein
MADPSSTDSTATSSPPTTTPSSPPEASSSSSATAAPPTPTCVYCAKSPDSLKQCLKCHSVSYCNKDCQKADFKVHKKICAGLAQEYTKVHEPKMASRSTASTKGARDRGLQKWQVSCFCEGESWDLGVRLEVRLIGEFSLIPEQSECWR